MRASSRRLKIDTKNIRLASALVILIFIMGFEFYYSGRFYPHTYIGDVAVGGMTYPEAEERIKPVLENMVKNGFNLEFIREEKPRSLNVPPSLTGFTRDTVVEYFSTGDTDKVLQSAYERGREKSLLRRTASKLSSIFIRKTYNSPHSVQKEAVFSLLDRELNGFLKGPQNAEFIEHEGGIAIQSGKPGAEINFEKVFEEMDKALAGAADNNLRFEVNLIEPSITDETLKNALEFANALSRSTNVEFWNGIYWWRARGPILATWLTLDPENKEPVRINPDKLKNFFRLNVDASIENKVENSRFQMRGGKLMEIVPGKAGFEVNLEKLENDLGQEIRKIHEEYRSGKITGGTVNVRFAIDRVPPKITKETISQYGITDMVGRAVVSFAGGSAARIHNIETGMSKINGVLIAPGEEFSTVDAIGYVGKEEGYRQELVIKKDATVKEYGGGLCQVATTLFRATLDAGLQITERQNHSYVVAYYGPGLDATIYGPHPDLRFINNTANYLLLQGYTENNNSIFEFYGKKDGRKVTISEPRISDIVAPPDTKYILTSELELGKTRCTERRNDGRTADVDYSVEYADSSVSTQTFTSKYVPWQQVCLLGTRQ